MSAAKHPHSWSHESLLDKAQRYASVMVQKEETDWEFGFWSALTLEMLARAALAKISPTLLADGKDWNNIYYALGYTPTVGKYVPKSVDTVEVLKRLEAIVPGFNREVHNFCVQHINRRNAELHSGDLPFDELGTSAWLPEYYRACQILLKSLGKTLGFLLGLKDAKVAETLVRSLEDTAAKAVGKIIEAHKALWKAKSDKDKDNLPKRAEAIATRHIGHRAKCPSCGSQALVHGSAIGAPTKAFEGERIVERQSMLPMHFECGACGLQIVGHSRLNACGLGDVFTSTSRYDAAEYFGVDDSSEMYYEEDFNE